MEKNMTDFEKEVLKLELRNKPPEYMNAREAALYLNFSDFIFNTEIKDFLNSVRFGKRINYKREDLDKFLNRFLVSPKKVFDCGKRN